MFAQTLMGGDGGFSGSWSLGNGVISGSQADVEYQSCLGATDCLTNTNPNAGLPHAGFSFAAAYLRALATSDFATDCVRIRGRWYVYNVHSGL